MCTLDITQLTASIPTRESGIPSMTLGERIIRHHCLWFLWLFVSWENKFSELAVLQGMVMEIPVWCPTGHILLKYMQTERKDVYTKSNCALLLAMCLESLLDKGPCTLQLKLQKTLLSYIHTTTFFHNYKDFFLEKSL